MKKKPQRSLVRTGKKIWEISAHYHCGILGTCMPNDELRVLMKDYATIDKNAPDYVIHGISVRAMNNKNFLSEAVQKILANKYQMFTARIYKENNAKQMYQLWQQSLTNGDFPGVLWAIMSHPLATEDLLKDVNGDLHVLTHESLLELHKEKQSIAKQAEKNNLLTLELQKAKEKVFAYEKELNQLKIQNLEYKENYQTYANMFHNSNLQEQKFQAVFDQLQSKYNNIENKLQIKKKQNQSRKEINASLNHQNKLLQTENEKLKHLLKEKDNELRLLENSFTNLKEKILNEKNDLHGNDVTHDQCDGNCDSCVHSKIKGRQIAYIGGLNSVVSNCRWLVEQNEGFFIHHDGGMEESKKQLPSIVLQADIVFCSINNVSHNAMHIIKKVCTQYQKKLIFLKGNGVSSFIRGIEENIAMSTLN